MRIALRDELITNPKFGNWDTAIKSSPPFWTKSNGDYSFSHLIKATGINGANAIKMNVDEGALWSTIIPVVNHTNVIYEFTCWYKIENWTSGNGYIAIAEYDNELTYLEDNFPVVHGANATWTQVIRTISANASADYVLNASTKYLRIAIYIGSTPSLDFYTSLFELGGARVIELDRGYKYPVDNELDIIGKRGETFSRNILAAVPHNTQASSGMGFIGLSTSDKEKLEKFFGSPEVKFKNNPFWLRDETGTWTFVRYTQDSFEVIAESGHHTYNCSFTYTEEI